MVKMVYQHYFDNQLYPCFPPLLFLSFLFLFLLSLLTGLTCLDVCLLYKFANCLLCLRNLNPFETVMWDMTRPEMLGLMLLDCVCMSSPSRPINRSATFPLKSDLGSHEFTHLTHNNVNPVKKMRTDPRSDKTKRL
jgi:hypothetical protein